MKQFWFGFIAIIVLITTDGYINIHATKTDDYDALLTFFTTSIDKKVVDCLKQILEKNKFLRSQISWLGFKQTSIIFNRDKRKYGKPGYSFGKLFHLAIDGITSFSDKSFLLVSKLGFAISFISLIIILYAIYSHFLLNRTITGWTFLIISSMFIGGVQLISIGIIGEYISRINKNVLNRLLYIIKNINIEKYNTSQNK